MRPRDGTLSEILKTAIELDKRGGILYQKFTCQHCGARLAMETPNTFYEEGICDKCGGKTDIEAQGCGFMLIMLAPGVAGPKLDRPGITLVKSKNREGRG